MARFMETAEEWLQGEERGVSVWGRQCFCRDDERVMWMEVKIGQQCEGIECHRTVYLKMVKMVNYIYIVP